MNNRFYGKCKCGKTEYLIFGKGLKEIYKETIFYFNDAELFWEKGEDEIKNAGNPKACCMHCETLMPFQPVGSRVFLPSDSLDEKEIEDFKAQVAAVSPERRAVKLVIDF